MMVEKKVKMVCPKCGTVGEVLEKHSHGEKIDGIKCSSCFKERFVFVNLVLTNYEKNKLKD